MKFVIKVPKKLVKLETLFNGTCFKWEILYLRRKVCIRISVNNVLIKSSYSKSTFNK